MYVFDFRETSTKVKNPLLWIYSRNATSAGKMASPPL
jgi:hypothetical protein